MAQNKSAKHAGQDGYYGVTVSNGAKQMLGMLDAVQPHSQGLSKSKDSFPRLPRESVLDMTNTSSGNILINWDPSHEDKFVTKTCDQPGRGSFLSCSLWGGEMKDPGNTVGRSDVSRWHRFGTHKMTTPYLHLCHMKQGTGNLTT